MILSITLTAASASDSTADGTTYGLTFSNGAGKWFVPDSNANVLTDSETTSGRFHQKYQ